MASALATFGASRGMQAGQGIASAYQTKLFSALQAQSIRNQMDEIDKRASIEIGQTFSAGRKIVAEQTAAFIKGGVELEGSAMDVISDTMSDAAEAAYIRRREADYEIVGLSMQEASLKEASSDMNFYLNSLSAIGGAYAGYKADEFNYNKKSARSLGTGTFTAPKVNNASNYTYNYSGANAQGLVYA